MDRILIIVGEGYTVIEAINNLQQKLNKLDKELHKDENNKGYSFIGNISIFVDRNVTPVSNSTRCYATQLCAGDKI